MKKKLFCILSCAILAAGFCFTTYADVGSAMAANTASIQTFFEQRRTIPTWLLEDLKNSTGQSVTLTSHQDKYAVTFHSESIREIDPNLARYDLTITRQLTDMSAYDHAVGENTPKYVINVPYEGELFADMTITLLDTSFAPHFDVHVYKVLGNQRYRSIAKDVTVGEDNSFSFTISEGGDYLISSRKITDRINNVFEQDYPQRADVDELLSFLTEDSRYDFSDLITRVEINKYD